MIFNYIKLAIRVLGRKKLFSAITLFGISFTLGILMVTLSFLQSQLGTDSPMGNKNKMVLLERLRLERIFYDTLITVDTILEGGIAVYDTTFDYKPNNNRWIWNSSFNNGIGEDYLKKLTTIDNITLYMGSVVFDTYVNGVKVSLNGCYTDPQYFEIFDHELIEGRTFEQDEMDQGAQVTVISTKAAEAYFGRTNGVIGEEMLLDGKMFKVIGVYPFYGKVRDFVCPEVTMLYSVFDNSTQETFYHGYYNAAMLKKDQYTFAQVKEEIDDMAKRIPLDHPSKPKGYNNIDLPATTYDEMFSQGIIFFEDEEKSYKYARIILFGLLLFFILLPTLNLVNLNVSRIMDRSSEIGVRKAFGANKANLITQFVVENVVQTIIGGIIGIALAIVLLNVINNSGALGPIKLQVNSTFFVMGTIITLIFGVMSGLIPAYRMSNLQIVNALKNNTK